MEGTETGALHFDQANVVPVTSRSNELDDDINLAHCIIHELAVDSGAEDTKAKLRLEREFIRANPFHALRLPSSYFL